MIGDVSKFKRFGAAVPKVAINFMSIKCFKIQSKLERGEGGDLGNPMA